MAIFNQDIVKFEHDAFSLQFIITDATTTITSTTHCAWWGLGNNSDINNCASLLLQGHTIANISTYDISTGVNDCSQSPDGSSLNPSATSVPVTITNNTVTCTLSYSLFSTIDDGSYAHELVLMDKTNNNTCHQCRSVVAAVGILTVNESMFTNFVYR
tara:strand:+ start:826 stop:1299 length:474 start_codon:yes stop_codon:yes gene_type:complete